MVVSMMCSARAIGRWRDIKQIVRHWRDHGSTSSGSAYLHTSVQDILAFGGIFLLLATKMVFFQNFPHHLANPNAEFQLVLGNNPKTGFDIMGFRGPVGPAEEAALRARAAGAPEIPGIDLRNPFI